ncbi:MAG TPA: pyridoxamine 5'-phosphate oxidase [Verrucomicrobiae bacterium]|jgi:pyridoxamine 5'-phosphate oxidase
MAIADIRREYSLGGLRRVDLDANPIAQFQKWFEEATRALAQKEIDVNAATLATADKNGKPSARIILLKGLDERGFVFYTNYESRKGRELVENPNAALTFYWPELERQICVAGIVEKVSRDESENYFRSRPRDSQLAAWASNQSDVVADRAALEARWNEMGKKFPNEVPLPPNWGGFILNPQRIEFWQGRASRLHDRFQYTKQPDNSWRSARLAP